MVWQVALVRKSCVTCLYEVAATSQGTWLSLVWPRCHFQMRHVALNTSAMYLCVCTIKISGCSCCCCIYWMVHIFSFLHFNFLVFFLYQFLSLFLFSYISLLPRSRMRGAVPPLPQYAFNAWCLVKAQGQLYLFTFTSTLLYSSITMYRAGWWKALPLDLHPERTWIPDIRLRFFVVFLSSFRKISG